MTKGMHNYIHHVNTWWWGKTITLVSKDGYSTVELQFDDNYPSIAFIKGLSVFSTRRKEGYGTEIMGCCEAVAKKEGYTFLQLSVNKEQDWLVEWYKHLGFVLIMKDEHEFTMLKNLKQMNHWKPSDEQIEMLENVRKILHTNKDIYGKANNLMYNFEDLIRTLEKLK